MDRKGISLVEIIGTNYSIDYSGILGIRSNEKNLTFLRIKSMVENNYRYQRISKSKLAKCAEFSVWTKL
ncbi:hypothetical protein F2Q69_00015100 [Brassica cretica]|uniref:Uncharacterized protein n=1 Tax=Brassica cretica TaxID=69181 RepID=A0A8S9QTN9_BRACR|nr:hypothetical protein F2Q69_00015100 [Brassica cretica]